MKSVVTALVIGIAAAFTPTSPVPRSTALNAAKRAVYALGDKCPPVNQPLSFGEVSADGTICDPVLGTKFNLKTGKVEAWCPSGLGKLIGGLFEPAGVPTYPVKAKG